MTPRQTRTTVVVIVVLVLLALVGISDIGDAPNGDGRGVSAPVATLIAGGFALLGAGLGLFGDRHLRFRGDILYKSTDWRMTCTLQNYWGPGASHNVPLTKGLLARERLMALAEYGNYSFSPKIFNETEVDTGLRDITVVFMDDSGTTFKTDVPQMLDDRGIGTHPDLLNLPARQWATAKCIGRIGPEEFESLARSTRVVFKAYLPRDVSFEREVTRLWQEEENSLEVPR